jgi:hypothetical protein
MAEQEQDLLQTPILDETQRATKVGGVTASSIWVSLQMISKLLNLGKISDSELTVIAEARKNYVEVLQHSFDLNYDEEVTKRVVEVQRRQAIIAAAQARARAEAEAAEAANEAANESANEDTAEETADNEVVAEFVDIKPKKATQKKATRKKATQKKAARRKSSTKK